MQRANSDAASGVRQSAFISGVSSGIGHSLAKLLLARGNAVYGVSRRPPADLVDHQNFHYRSIDFACTGSASDGIGRFLAQVPVTSPLNVFLNVGQFGKRIARVSDVALDDLEELMRVNVWSHKLVLDQLIAQGADIRCAVFSASIAGVRARAGNSGYAITKAALNMMAKLYALEHRDIRFLVLGLCTVQTNLSQSVASLPMEGHFPDIAQLRERAAAPGYLVTPDQRASDILRWLDNEEGSAIPSGDFVEIRAVQS